MSDLTNKRCIPRAKGDPALPLPRARELTREIAGWELNEDSAEIRRVFRFKNFHETMAFVNAVAWIAHREDHHPELEVGYNRCVVHYRTHSVDGLSENDFICAAKIDALFPPA